MFVFCRCFVLVFFVLNVFCQIERLREILGGSFGVSLRGMSPPLLFPLCPELRTSGIDHTTATLYKSNLLPLGLDWRVTRTGNFSRCFLFCLLFFVLMFCLLVLFAGVRGEQRAVDSNLTVREGVLIKRTIFKKGDDLRQDQLVTAFVQVQKTRFSLYFVFIVICKIVASLLSLASVDLAMCVYRVLATGRTGKKQLHKHVIICLSSLSFLSQRV
jgi:hypothetical protein